MGRREVGKFEMAGRVRRDRTGVGYFLTIMEGLRIYIKRVHDKSTDRKKKTKNVILGRSTSYITLIQCTYLIKNN